MGYRKKPDEMPWEKRNPNGYTKASIEGFYNKMSWRKLRDYVIKNEPLCRECLKQGRVRPATLVDHIKSIEEFPDLALDEDNLQPLCEKCHRDKTRRDHSKYSDANLQRGRDLMDDLES